MMAAVPAASAITSAEPKAAVAAVRAASAADEDVPKVVLITGASSGIGFATATLFAREGFSVLATGRCKDALKRLKQEVSSFGGVLCTFCADVTDDKSVAELVKFCVEEFGRLDVLVCSAGVLRGGALGSAACDVDSWDLQMNTNARSVFVLLTACIPLLKASAAAGHGGNAVVISSVNGRQSFAGLAAVRFSCCSSIFREVHIRRIISLTSHLSASPITQPYLHTQKSLILHDEQYCSSKAAVDMLVQCAALDLAKDGVRVNSVNPGVTLTELHRRGGKTEDEYNAFLDKCQTTHPLAGGIGYGRPSKPDEIAGAVLFLANATMGCQEDSKNMITGAHLAVDGGRLCLGAR